MSVTGREEADPPLDQCLEELMRGIVTRSMISDAEKRQLEFPRLTVSRGVPGINSYCVRQPDGHMRILMGTRLYPLFHYYARVAASYLLPIDPDGPRPSPIWNVASAELVSTLEWIASGSEDIPFREFELTKRQGHAAKIFGDLAYRFALCHEIAHVLCNHLDSGSYEERKVDDADAVAALQESHRREMEADRVALTLHVTSLPELMVVPALASSIYFIHMTGLLDIRLQLLAHLVDYQHWQISKSHPPAHARSFFLAKAALALGKNAGDGLLQVDSDLKRLDHEVYALSSRQQDETMTAAITLIRQCAAGLDEPQSADLTRRFNKLVDRSPLGVLRALETDYRSVAEHSDSWRNTIHRLTLQLPVALQPFIEQTRADRAANLA